MFRFHLIAILLLFAVLLTAKGYGAHTVYTSPNGDNMGRGTVNRPCSISRAIELANNKNVKEIILRDGIYEPKQPLVLKENPSRKRPLLIRAETPGKATISGGIVLTASSSSEGKIKEYPKPMDSLLRNSRDLYVGNSRAVRARSILYTSWDNNFSAIPSLTKSNRHFKDSKIEIAPDSRLMDYSGPLPHLRDWRGIQDVEFVFRCAWWEKRIGVESVTENQLTFSEPGWSTLNTPWASEGESRLNAQMPKMTFVEGAIELLDSPSEWYNGTENVLLIPPTGFDSVNDEVRIARLETLLKFEQASNIEIQGITFSHTTWQARIKSNGFNEGQANFEQIGSTGSPSESVGVYQSNNISFEDCTFKNLGGWGLAILEASKNINIQDCSFIDIAGNAIVVGSTHDKDAIEKEEHVSDVTIADSWIHKPASVYHGGVGIFVGHASKTTILNNEVCHAPYTGISIGWGWRRFDSQRIQTHKNKIEGNHVHHYLYNMYDGGGIYTLGPQSNINDGIERGLIIKNNAIHNQGGIGNIIYSDGGSRWITIDSNYTFNNLAELENYYDQKAMYVPDWGGCNPFGDLVFSNNKLGNIAMRSPNFRCSPGDPEPWNPNFSLPPNTQYTENIFDNIETQLEKSSHLSETRHDSEGIKSNNAIIAISASIPSQKSQMISFSLSSDSIVEVTLPLSRSLKPTLKSQGLSKILRERESTLFLKQGEYQLSLESEEYFLDGAILQLESSKANITRVSSMALKTAITTLNDSFSKYLFYTTNPNPEKLSLSTNGKDKLAQNTSWIDAPYHWQTLRAFIDTRETLPKEHTKAILIDLPSGRFNITQPQHERAPTLTIRAVSTESK